MELFTSILHALLKHWAKLLVFPALAAIAMHFLVKDQPLKYRSEVRLYLKLQENKGIGLSENEIKQYQVHTYFLNLIELLKASPTLQKVQMLAIRQAFQEKTFFNHGAALLSFGAEATLNRLDSLETLRAPFEPHNPIDQTCLQFIAYHQLQPGRLAEMANAVRMRDCNFLKFELIEHSPQKAQALARLFTEALIAEYEHLSKKQIKGQRALIENLVKQAKQDLDGKIALLEQYKLEHGIINLGEHTKAIVTYLVELEGQKAGYQSKRAAALRGSESVLQSIREGNELLADLSTHQEIIDLKTEIKQRSRKKNAGHPARGEYGQGKGN
jgi:uncharacterized protein involved in exopolysaccharide biosynthesis